MVPVVLGPTAPASVRQSRPAPALPRPSVSHGPSTAPLPPLEPSLRSLVAKRYPWSRLRGTAAGLLEHRLEVRLRGLQSILVTPTYREPHGFSSFPLLCGNRGFSSFPLLCGNRRDSPIAFVQQSVPTVLSASSERLALKPIPYHSPQHSCHGDLSTGGHSYAPSSYPTQPP